MTHCKLVLQKGDYHDPVMIHSLKPLDRPYGLSPNGMNNLYHNEGNVRNTAAVPPTAIVAQPLGGPAPTGIPTVVQRSPITIEDLYENTGESYRCKLNRGISQCDHTSPLHRPELILAHILNIHVKADLIHVVTKLVLEGRSERHALENTQILTTIPRALRAAEYAWRCPAPLVECRSWRMYFQEMRHHVRRVHPDLNPDDAYQLVRTSGRTARFILMNILATQED